MQVIKVSQTNWRHNGTENSRQRMLKSAFWFMRYACKACSGFAGVYVRHRKGPLQRDLAVTVGMASLLEWESSWGGLPVPCMEEYHRWRTGLMWREHAE